MAIQTTRWSPDTCACVLDYTWDDQVDPTVRTHSAKTSVSHCSFHAGLDLATHFTKLADESSRKNVANDVILTQVPTLTLADITWSYDANRVLDISCPKLTTQQKTTLQNAANTRFGVGKVLFL